MKRIFSDYAYGPGPRDGCWWDETCDIPDWPELTDDIEADVAIIGGGFTGLSAALHLAEAGANVALLEAQSPGFGASGRNGGFCCLGGSFLPDHMLQRQVGKEAAKEFAQAEIDAVNLVDTLVTRFEMTVDRHSHGETLLAHSPRALRAMRRQQTDSDVTVIEREDLTKHGMNGPFLGAVTTPHGFGLNPRKYLAGLARAAQNAGARLFQNSPAMRVEEGLVSTAEATIRARDIIIATNGYSSEDTPKAMAGRYMPVQSNVLVTRPLSDAELNLQGWTTDQMCYDTRGLLHYFRLMPDRRFLFGMRGGLRSSPSAEASARARALRDFRVMFRGWSNVAVTHQWSGMACLSPTGLPFVGLLPATKAIHAAFAYHGNGIAMGSYCGALIARHIAGQDTIPPAMRTISRFPLGRFRRALLPPFYLARRLLDSL